MLLISTLLVCAVALIGLELWCARTSPDPAVAARGGEAGDKWRDLVHRASAVEGLAYELVPGYEGRYGGELPFDIRINSEGLRDEELRAPRADKLLRIAVLGDSTTFGYGVSNEETYAQLLEERLNEAETGWQYEVLNFGTSGYNTLDEALVLREKALRYEPDFVLLGYNLNDPDIERIQPLHRYFAELPWWQDTHLYQTLARQAFERRIEAYPDRFAYAHDPERRNWKSVEQAFADIAECSADADLVTLVAIFPTGICNAKYRFAAIHEQVSAAARAAGLEVLDLFAAYAAVDELYILPDLHPNPLGHQIAADALCAWVLVHHEAIFDGRTIQR